MNRRPSTRRALAAVVLLATCIAMPAAAQRTRARPAASGTARATSAIAVRAELAAVLLQGKRYEEAAREYRGLLAENAGSYEYRLGLARALAWGEHPREAERELTLLAQRRPGDATVDALLRATRASFEPRAAEASAWVSERPGYAPYRLALARALVRDGWPLLAIAQYDTLLAASPSDSLVKEKADAYVRGGRLESAIAQFDTLLAVRPTPELYLERAQLRLRREEVTAATADVEASLALRPSVAAYVLQGNLAYWRGDFAAAHTAYLRARMLRPGDRAVAAALAQLERDERPVIASVDAPNAAAGWQVENESIADNLGARYTTLRLRRGVALPAGFVGGVSGEVRQLGGSDRIATEFDSVSRRIATTGVAVSGALEREVVFGSFALRAGARGGVVQHAGHPTMTESAVALGLWYRAWNVSAALTAEPAYPSLLTIGALIGVPDATDPLLARSVAASVGGPAGPVDLALRFDRTRYSDDNEGTTVQGYARYALSRNLALMYASDYLSFTERRALYWTPLAYVAQSAGLELAARRRTGLSVALRALPGFAWTKEEVIVADSLGGGTGIRRRLAPQLTAGGELSYRSARWEMNAGLSYGRGRAGDYQRVAATATVRLKP